MKKIKRTALLVALLWFVSLTGAGIYEFLVKPIRVGQIPVKGLSQPTEVNFDRWGVPYIKAETTHDAFFALGFLHGQDRLQQMLGIRRVSQGRLAEIAGSKFLESDKFFRSLGIPRKAQQILNAADLSHPAFRSMQAYLDGLNAYTQTHQLPLDVLAIEGRPKPFTLVDMLSVAAYVSFTFDRSLKSDTWLHKAKSDLTRPLFDELDSGFQPQSISSHESLSPKLAEQLAVVEQAMDQYGRFQGSNAWVVAGRRTQSGKPMLANDTHIRVTNPSLWYEAHLEAPGLNVYGHFLPLISLPLLGNTPSHAWGLTIFHNNDIDLVLEKQSDYTPGNIMRNGQEIGLVPFEDIIKVKDAPDVPITTYQSDIGPVLVDHIKGLTMSLRWTFMEASPKTFTGLFGLLDADSIQKAETTLQKIESPSLNILYANISGDIAWWTTGLIADSGMPDPTAMLSGESYQVSYRPLSENPKEINPDRGYIFSTNQQPQKVPGYYSFPERQRRLELLLSERRQWGSDDFKRLQNDTTVGYHHSLIMKLGQILNQTESLLPLSHEAFAALDQWQGSHDTQDIAPTIFYQFLYEVFEATFQDEMGLERFREFLKRQFALPSLVKVFNHQQSLWWDNINTEYKESRRDILINSWRQTLTILTNLYGYDVKTWAWGRHHQLELRHPLGSLPVLGWFYNLGPYPAPGGVETLNQISFTYKSGPVTALNGPATRKIVDLGTPHLLQSILPTGQSGRVFDVNFQNQLELYLSGEYRTIDLSKKNRFSQLVLKAESATSEVGNNWWQKYFSSPHNPGEESPQP